MLRYAIGSLRYALLLLYALTAYQGVRYRGRGGWYTLAAMMALALGTYGSEFFWFGTPGIWFPFGIGLSLNECAYAVFAPLLAVLLVRRLWPYARSPRLGQQIPV